ncbi:hypothetical protein [Paraburkholderia caribensis]|uniref:hypothetical protein n=1 Tax=Paraburkholderia caribensis TaxID=75105 RepID=UPI001CC67CF9|nr:hypothetical protein [Paraburkholderia caribensis]
MRERYDPPRSDTANWVYRNEKATFSVHDGKSLAIEEWPEDKRPSDRTDRRLEERLASAAATDADVGEAAEAEDRAAEDRTTDEGDDGDAVRDTDLAG